MQGQMAKGFLKSFNNSPEMYSAESNPAERTSQKALAVMREKGIDISGGMLENIEKYLNK